MSQDGPRDPRVLGAVVVVVALAAVGVVWLLQHVPGPSDASTSGNVVTVDGRAYWVSGERVLESALGDVVARGVAYQGTTADLRAVDGFPTDQVLAAYLPPQRSGQTGPGWTFVAVDQPLGTNPMADPRARAVLQP